jgi:D-erythronate 2-dehydrogenase
MRILVVGQGFIGQALVARLRSGASIDGQAASLITVLDQRVVSRIEEPRMRYVEADISERSALEHSIEGGVDCVFHLASVPGGAAECDFELGLKVNLHSTPGCSKRCGSRAASRSWCSPAASASMVCHCRA